MSNDYDYWMSMARTYMMMCIVSNKRYHAELGRRACIRAIKELDDSVNILPLVRTRLPTLPGNTSVYDRRKFLRY